MNSEDAANSENKESELPRLNKLIWQLIVPLIVGVVLLVIEYRLGFFVPVTRSDASSSLSPIWPILVTVFLSTSLLLVKDCLRIWLRPYRYVREQFALVSLAALASLTLMVVVCIFIGLMPWSAVYTLIRVLSGRTVSLLAPHWSEYGLLIMGYVGVVVGVRQMHRQWRGLKSLEHHLREQRSEDTNILVESVFELHRIIKRKPPLRVYPGADAREYITQLEPVVDSLAWKDQAKELLRLTSSSYAFDSDSGWHDSVGYWVGTNVDNDGWVFLYPSQGLVSQSELKDFIRYADRIAKTQDKRPRELVVAFKENVTVPTKYKSQKRIRFETEDSLLNRLVTFTDYSNEIRKRVLVDRLTDSTLSIDDTYAPSRIIAPDGEESPVNVEEFLIEWLNEPGQRQLALLGEYGQGKSTTALMFTYRLLCEQDPPHQYIPILTELRGMSPRSLTPLQLLGAWAAQYNINPQALMRLHIAGRILLIFEGFDEMTLVGDAEMRLKHFRTLWQFCYPQAKILITGRPNFFLDEEEMKAALGISKPVGTRPYCESIRLEPFTISQIEHSLRNHPRLVRSQICSFAGENSRFKELISRPSLLHIVAVLWDRAKLSEKIEELDSAYVMDLFVRHSYRRQGVKEAESPDFMALTSSEREYFMMGVASYMAANDLPNQITGSQLNDVIEALIDAIPEAVSTGAPAISGERTTPLRLRLEDSEYALEHVKTDVRACGLLVDDPVSPGTFHFGHKSFMEYLFAAVVAECIKEASEEARSILKATRARIEDVLGLPVTTDFLSELLGTGGGIGGAEASSAERAKRRSEQAASATRLLKAILGERGRLGYLYQRFLVFNSAYLSSFRHLGSTKRVLFIFSAPQFLLMLMTMPLCAYLVLRGESRYALPGLLLYSILTYLMARQFRLGDKLRLWNLICKKIGVQDDVLHQIAGTRSLPWARHRPFDLFLGPTILTQRRSESTSVVRTSKY